MQYTNLHWRDGQPYSEIFDDIYYASNDSEQISGEKEFDHVFFKHNGLPGRWRDAGDFVIAELGFGSGLNCMLTMREWLKHLAVSKTNKCLHYIAIEKHPLSPEAISELISRYPELKIYCDELIDNYPPAIEATHSRRLFDGRIIMHYKFMDVNKALADESLNVDAWYLDGFSPAKNADMWSESLFMKIALNSHVGTTCSTYTAAGFVKRNLQEAGFFVSKAAGYGKKREMLVARFDQKKEISLKYADNPWYVAPSAPAVSLKKATIIGAGIAGLCMAHALIKRGWSIDLIDRQGDVARETSANPAAIIYPRLSVNNDPDSEFYTAAYCYSLYELRVLQEKSEREFWFDTGLLQLMDKARISQIINKFDLNRDYVSITEKVKDMDESICTAIARRQQVYADYKTAGVVLPRILCDVLKDECGDRLHIVHAEISEIKNNNSRWQSFSVDNLITESEILIIANGVGVNDLGMPLNFPIETVRGQGVELMASDDSKKITKVVNSGFYITPAIKDRHYLGATYSRDNKSLDICPDDNRLLFESVKAIFPGLFKEDDCCDAWAGLRSMSKDRAPLIGAVPDEACFHEEYADICHGKGNKSYQPARYLDGLYISAAHGSRGFTSSFISAEIIAAQIAGEPLPVRKNVMDHINPSRFIVNDLKRR